VYNVTGTRISLEDLLLLCPNEDGTGADATRLTNLMKEANAEAEYVKSLYPDFFELNNSTGEYQLKNSISDRLGQQVDCTQSQAFCWEAIKIWFSTNAAGEQAFAGLCNTLYNRFQKQSIKRQAEIRRVLCIQGSSAAMSSCEPLASQVLRIASNASGCDAVSVPAEANQIPSSCEPGDGATGGGNGKSASLPGPRTGGLLLFLLGVSCYLQCALL
jgi:hypothetical protein